MTEKLSVNGYELPSCDTSDPAQLAAWFGNYSFFDHFRKVVLSNCEEIIRAEAAVKGEKITDGRTDTLAHVHPNYLQFLADGLEGRILYEREVRAAMRAV